MILEYSYDNALKVLNLLKTSQIATLFIKEKNNICAIDFTLISDYPEPKQANIRPALNESMAERIAINSLFNNFMVSKLAGKNVRLELNFNAVNVRKCEITYKLDGEKLIKAQDENYILELTNCLERYEHLITQLGVSDYVLDSVFKKEGSGRGKKTVPITLKDLSSITRRMINK